jgi:hypothetical protein
MVIDGYDGNPGAAEGLDGCNSAGMVEAEDDGRLSTHGRRITAA